MQKHRLLEQALPSLYPFSLHPPPSPFCACHAGQAIGDLHAQILSVSLPQFSRLFCLLSSKILQNSLLDLYLVDIRGYKLSFFAKPAHKNSPRSPIKFKSLSQSKVHRGWNEAVDWLNLLTSFVPNLGAEPCMGGYDPRSISSLLVPLSHTQFRLCSCNYTVLKYE